MGRIVVVTSGKGGTGKSTVSAGLAYALARLGKRILLIDGDAGLRSLDLMLGVGGNTVYDISDVFAGRCEPIKAVYASPVFQNVFMIPAPLSLQQLCSPGDMKRLVRGLSQYYDVVIVDCPAGIGKGFETAAAAAEQALVVSTPDMVCARDAHILSDLLREKQIPARLIINRLRPRKIMDGSMPDIDQIIDESALQLLGVIPEDETVAVANANGRPLPLDCNAALCFSNIAHRFIGDQVLLAALEKM